MAADICMLEEIMMMDDLELASALILIFVFVKLLKILVPLVKMAWWVITTVKDIVQLIWAWVWGLIYSIFSIIINIITFPIRKLLHID